jgi:hypothetical protein
MQAAAGEKPGKDPPPKQAKLRFTIGKETTVVAGPLDKDGLIDYPAALNERMRKGITPKTNANMLIWQAIGPRPEGQPMPAEFFAWLQIEAPPEKGDYFIGLETFIKDHLKIDDREQIDEIHNQQSNATRRVWGDRQYPHIAAWLKANEKPIALVVEATKRPHYFSPLVPGKNEKGSTGMLTASVSSVQKCRELATALTARALRSVEEGKRDDAWQDLLACHRLARHVGKGASLIESLVSIALDHLASAADLAFLERAKLDAKQIAACLRDLQQLPPLPAVVEKIDQGERFMFHDSVMMMMRQGPEYLETIAGKSSGKPHPIAQRYFESIDWDPAMRKANQWFDGMVAAMRNPDRAQRAQHIHQVEVDIKELKAKSFPNAATMARMVLGTPEMKGQVIGDILVTLLLPAVMKIQQAGDRNEQVQRNLHLAFALAAYRHEHGRYPAKLDDLAPKHLAKVEPDLFTGKPLVYRPMDGGYLLYSFGVDGRDNEGQGYDDEPRGDDLAVRMPLPKLRKN